MTDLVSISASNVVINTSSHAVGNYNIKLRGTIVERSANAFKDADFVVTVFTYTAVPVNPIEYSIGQGSTNHAFTGFTLDPPGTGGFTSTYDLLLTNGSPENHAWLMPITGSDITINTSLESDAGAYSVELRGRLDDAYQSSTQTTV